MKLVSWNVNGYRAVLKKNFREWLAAADPDILGLQEIKAEKSQLPQADAEPEGYFDYWNPARVKKGYSGTLCLAKHEPLNVSYGLPEEEFQGEGRLILLEYERFFFFNIYFPNGARDHSRVDFKLQFYDSFLNYAQALREQKPVVVCGDFNTAHTEIDLARPKDNEKTTGFLPDERARLDRFVDAGYIDTFRLFQTEGGHYSWWAYWAKSREKNIGWRIDYFFVSEELRDAVKNAWIESGVMGSDHCPVGLELDV